MCMVRFELSHLVIACISRCQLVQLDRIIECIPGSGRNIRCQLVQLDRIIECIPESGRNIYLKDISGNKKGSKSPIFTEHSKEVLH